MEQQRYAAWFEGTAADTALGEEAGKEAALGGETTLAGGS